MRKFFVVGMGRSGTKFLANLLNRDQKAYVQHEPYDLDKQLIFYRYAGSFDTVIDQLLEERFKNKLDHVNNNKNNYKIYGEVNSYLRYEVDWLRKKGWECYCIARDGRDFVRSAYSRKTFRPNDSQQSIVPKDGTKFASRWGQMSRFEKLCWYWSDTNEYLLSKFENDKIVKFEKVISDYDYLNKKLLEPEGLKISRNLWKKRINEPKNTTKFNVLKRKIKRRLLLWRDYSEIDQIPNYHNWSDSKQEMFKVICSKTMKKLNYNLQK